MLSAFDWSTSPRSSTTTRSPSSCVTISLITSSVIRLPSTRNAQCDDGSLRVGVDVDVFRERLHDEVPAAATGEVALGAGQPLTRIADAGDEPAVPDRGFDFDDLRLVPATAVVDRVATASPIATSAASSRVSRSMPISSSQPPGRCRVALAELGSAGNTSTKSAAPAPTVRAATSATSSVAASGRSSISARKMACLSRRIGRFQFAATTRSSRARPTSMDSPFRSMSPSV